MLAHTVQIPVTVGAEPGGGRRYKTHSGLTSERQVIRKGALTGCHFATLAGSWIGGRGGTQYHDSDMHSGVPGCSPTRCTTMPDPDSNLSRYTPINSRVAAQGWGPQVTPELSVSESWHGRENVLHQELLSTQTAEGRKPVQWEPDGPVGLGRVGEPLHSCLLLDSQGDSD